jgi:hypothetical protein
MGKAFLGFLVGTALASLAFVLLDKDPTTRSPEAATSVASLSRSAPDTIPGIVPANESPNASERLPATRSSLAVAEAAHLPEELTQFVRGDVTRVARRELLSDWSDEELRDLIQRAEANMEPTQQMVEAGGVRNLATSELRDRELLARWADEGPPESPIRLPPEFSYLSDPDTIDHNHESHQRDPVDPGWSRQMEAQIQGFFVSRPEITATYGYPTITCRTLACEIAFVAYGIGSAEPEPERSWNTHLAFWRASEELYQQPWSAQLNRNAGFPEPRFHDNGAVTFLWRIPRVTDRN